MKRFFLLLAIGALLVALAFACGTEKKQEQPPDEGDSIEVGTLKVDSTNDSAQEMDMGKAIEQDTLQQKEEPLHEGN